MKAARVLLVDDEIQIREIMQRALAQRGHLAAGAECAEAAKAALSAGTFDLVLLDHVLPGVTGMQVLGKLRTLTKAPIYIMSGYTGEHAQDVMLLGERASCPPIDLAVLFALIDALPEKA